MSDRPDEPARPAAGPPPDWYPDPMAPTGRTGRRWWDGSTWTEHVAADPAPGVVGPVVTPDGVPIAGMGRRIGAFVIDSLIVGVVAMLLGLPFLLAVFRAYGAYFERALDAANAGAQPPSSLSLYSTALGPLTGLYAVLLVVTLTYHIGFLRWRSATPGKLAVGLRVRARDGSGRLDWRTVWRRWASEYWYTVVALVPVVGGITGLYVWADDLSALGNPERRALHDRFADTVVVDVRANR